VNFTVRILGTSSAHPNANRFPTSHILNIYGKYILIDCGEGTQIQLRKFKIPFGHINHIFISHLHGDHFFGLFGLLSTYELLHRGSDLHLYAPVQLRDMLFSPQSPVKVKELPYKIWFHPLRKGHNLVMEDKNFFVESFELDHRIPTWGFIVKEKKRKPNVIKSKIEEYSLGIEEILAVKRGEDIIRDNGQVIKAKEVTTPAPEPRSYSFVSDTRFFPPVVEHIKGTDLLYHESTFIKKDEDLAAQTYHSTAEQAAMIAKQAGAKQLVIGHFSARYKDTSVFLDEAGKVFKNTVLAYDGLKLEIPLRKISSEE